MTNHHKLSPQFDWRGRSVRDLRILVCWRCEDKPQRQIGTLVLPPDPRPVLNARPEPYPIDETPVTTRVLPDGRIRSLPGGPPYRQRIIIGSP